MPPLEWASPLSSHEPDPPQRPDSLRNTVGSDLDALLGNPMLDMATLTVFDKGLSKPFPHISPKSTSNITVRKTNTNGLRNFRGWLRTKSLFQGDLHDLHDVPITTIGDIRGLRVSIPNEVPK